MLLWYVLIVTLSFCWSSRLVANCQCECKMGCVHFINFFPTPLYFRWPSQACGFNTYHSWIDIHKRKMLRISSWLDNFSVSFVITIFFRLSVWVCLHVCMWFSLVLFRRSFSFVVCLCMGVHVLNDTCSPLHFWLRVLNKLTSSHCVNCHYCPDVVVVVDFSIHHSITLNERPCKMIGRVW